MTTSIQPLTKVTLTLLAGTEPARYNLTNSPVVFQFLHGISTEGLAPFEIALGDKCPGEVVVMTVSSEEAAVFFGRFFGEIRRLLALHIIPSRLFLQLTVKAVHVADDREVVKALAHSAGHGSCAGSSCGCGCGSE